MKKYLFAIALLVLPCPFARSQEPLTIPQQLAKIAADNKAVNEQLATQIASVAKVQADQSAVMKSLADQNAQLFALATRQKADIQAANDSLTEVKDMLKAMNDAQKTKVVASTKTWDGRQTFTTTTESTGQPTTQPAVQMMSYSSMMQGRQGLFQRRAAKSCGPGGCQ